jgi:hypothetical protein
MVSEQLLNPAPQVLIAGALPVQKGNAFLSRKINGFRE